MAFISEVRGLVEELAAFAEIDVPSRDLPAGARRLDDEALVAVISRATQLINSVERLRVVSAGVAAERSTRESGYSGVAQTRGHRTPVALIQSITWVSRAEAAKQVQLGESMLEGGMPGAGLSHPSPAHADLDSPPVEAPWHEPLRLALLDGRLTSAQHHSILRGLGEPPLPNEGETVELEGIMRAITEVREVWRIAAEQLMIAASGHTTEDLLREARRTRDLIHPEGALERFAKRYENRAFRLWSDENGQFRAHFVLDDEGAAWIRAMIDAALRPRRGGPRFVTDEERDAARTLIEDPRSNDQLAYDLMLAMLRAGSLATPEQVFGARQPGVRMIIQKDATRRRDAFGRMLGIGRLEDRGDVVIGPVIDRALCATGSQEIVIGAGGDPLRLGREQRPFSARQKVGLSVRDGGCLFSECAMPASYCEAHHIDHFARDHGRTDLDRGVLLCAFHHLLMHNNGWEITREGLGDFVLHPPPGMGEPLVLQSKTPLAFRLLA